MPEPTTKPTLPFKGQPWRIFDTIAAYSYLLGDGTNLAIGTQIPAISANGDMIFLNAGRTRAAVPNLTNMDQSGQLSYGFNLWAAALRILFPIVTPNQNNGYDPEVDAGVAPTEKLAEAIMNFGVLTLDLGQEEQMAYPCLDFKCAGGLHITNAIASAYVQNSVPADANVLSFPEPVECARTQNITAKIQIAPEARALIGTLAAPGVGSPRSPYVYSTDETHSYNLPELPYAIQLILVGERIKRTQYGQTAD